MRAVLASVLVLAATAPAGHADQLIGGPIDGSQVRFLTPDLEPVPGSPSVALGAATALSPDGRRFLEATDSRGRIAVRDTRTGRVLRRLGPPPGDLIDLVWDSPDHVQVTSFAPGTRGDRIQFFDLRRRTTRVRRLPRDDSDPHVAGGRVRTTAIGRDDSVTLVSYALDGKDVRRVPVELPRSWRQRRGVTAEVLGRFALINGAARSGSLPPLLAGPDGRARELDLPDDSGARWLTPRLVQFATGVARISRTGTVTETVEVPQSPAAPLDLLPYRGGFINGFGQDRYDADLDRVGGTQQDRFRKAFLVGDRLYGQAAASCDEPSPAATADVQVATVDGELLPATRTDWFIGTLDGDRLEPDDCS